MYFDKYLPATFQKQNQQPSQMSVHAKRKKSMVVSSILAKKTPDFDAKRQQEQKVKEKASYKYIQSSAIRTINRIQPFKKNTSLDEINLLRTQVKSQKLLALEQDRVLVGIEINKIDSSEMTIKVYVNGVPGKEKKKFPLEAGDIVIKAKKGYMYANPFILQPMEVSSSHQSNGKIEARWINKTELIVDMTHQQDYKALQVASGASYYPFINKFTSNLQLSQFICSTQAKILSNYPQEFTNIIPSLSESSSSDCTSLLDEIENSLREIISKQSSSLFVQSPTDPQVQFYPISDKRLPSMIIRKGNKIKSIPLNEDGTYDLEGLHFGDPPKFIDDEITLHLPIKNICMIFQSLKNQFWPSIDSKNILGALLLPFLKQFATFVKTGQIMQKALYVPCIYKDALLFFQTLIVLIQKELQSISSKQSFLFSDLQRDEQMLKSVIQLPYHGQPLPAQEAKQKQEKKKDETKEKQEKKEFNLDKASNAIRSSYYQLLELLCVASKFQDQLYAISQSNQASPQLSQLWNSSIRIHTAFGRLSSFTSASQHFFNHYTQDLFGISNHSAYKMADAGLLAVRNDSSTSYRLWTSSTAFIPTSDISRFKSIPQLLHTNYPQTYDNIISKFNIPLSHTIKYLPAVKFSSDNVAFIKPAEKRVPYLLVGYTDQTVAIINGKIRPFPIMTISFKTGKSGSTIAQSLKSSINKKPQNFEVEILQSQKSKQMRLLANKEKLEVSPSTKEAQQLLKAYTLNAQVDSSVPKKPINFKQVPINDAFFQANDQNEVDDEEDDQDEALIDDIFPLDLEEQPPVQVDQQPAFEPNAQILQILLSMGFDKTISVQALKKCQNKGIEAALDQVEQIQKDIENKIKQLSMPSQVKQQQPKIVEKLQDIKQEDKQLDEPEEVKQKRQLLQAIYQNCTIFDLNLIQVNQYSATNNIKYRVEAVFYSELGNKVAVFSSGLMYSLSVVETIGHLHKNEALHLVPLNSLNGPQDKIVQRFDLRSILPMYSQTVETLLPIFTKRRTAFELEGMCNDLNNYQIFQDVKSISNIRSLANQSFSIISGKDKTAYLRFGKTKMLQAELHGFINWQEVQMIQNLKIQKQSFNSLYLAKIKNKDQLIILKQQSGSENKLVISPASEPFQLNFDSSLSNISVALNTNKITIETPQVIKSYSITETSQKGFQIKQIQPPKPIQVLVPQFDPIQNFLQRGFYSLREEIIQQNQICQNPTALQLPNMSILTPSFKATPLLQQTLMFKQPIPVLTSIDISCIFTQNQKASFKQFTNSCSVERTSMSGPDYRYMNQILNNYSPVTSSSSSMTDHQLSLILVSKNQSNTQSSIGCVLTYPKILLDANSSILQSNPFIQENDCDFLFQHVDGKQILVSQIKFELMIQWGQVTMLIYTGDSIEQIYANDSKTNTKQTQQVSPQKKIQYYQKLLQSAKTSGKELTQADPVALIKVTKSDVAGYQANLGNNAEKRFDIQFKRPAKYLRIKILDKISKKSERYSINCFQAFGSQIQDMYLSRVQCNRSKFNKKRWIQSGFQAKVQLTLKKDNNQGTIAYQQVDVVKRTGMKQERNQIKITEILSPEKRFNTQVDALSQLKSLESGDQAKLGKFTTLSHLSIPIFESYQNVIGIKVKLLKKNSEEQEQKNCWIPASIKIRAYQQTYPLLHRYRSELLNFTNFDKLVELAHTSQKGVNLILKLLLERPDFIDKFSASLQVEQIMTNVLFGQSHDTVDIYSTLQLISIILDSDTMSQEFQQIGKSYLKLQRFITQKMSRSGVYFFLSLCKYHFNEANNIQFLEIFQALNSLIFTKFSKMNPQALNAFKEAKSHFPIKIPKDNFSYEILQKRDVQLVNLDNSEEYQKPFQAISVQFPPDVGYYVKEIVIQFTKNKDCSSSHFPDWGYITAIINIDPKSQGQRQISARFNNFLGISDRYSIQFSQELFVRDQIQIRHLSSPSDPIINMGSFNVTVFGLSLYMQSTKALFTNQRYRFETPALPSTVLPEIQQEALQSLPHKPKQMDSLLKLLVQSRSISEFIVQNIINSIQHSSIQLSGKQAQRCFSLWMHLPQDFPWEQISNKIQYMSKVIFAKVPSYDAAHVSIQQLRSCLIGGKSAVSHTALLKFIQGLGFPSNFIYAYLQRYFGGSNTNTAFIFTSTQFNGSKFKSQSSNNFILLYILAQLGQNLPYTTGDAQTIFKNYGKIKLSNYTDITLPTTRVQKNKIISNVLRGLLENSNMYTLQELVALVRVLLLSLVMGIKPDPTDVIKYLYGDTGKKQNSLMVKLIIITLESKDPELKILLSNLANLTKTNSSVSQHVEAPLIVLSKLTKQLPRESLNKSNDLTVSQWIAKVKFLIYMTAWKSNMKMKDFIFSLCSQILPTHNSSSNNNPSSVLCQSYQFWQLLTDLIYRLRSNISSKSKEAINFCQNFILFANESNRTEFYKVAVIISAILQDATRDQTSQKSKMAKNIFRAVFNMFNIVRNQNEWSSILGFIRQIFLSITISLNEERAYLFHLIVTHLLNRIQKWSLDDPSCASLIGSQYIQLAYEIMQKTYSQKDSQAQANVFATVLGENQLEQVARGMIRWFFLTEEILPSKQCNNQENCIRFITDGLYKMFVILCETSSFRKKAMIAIMETVITIDQSVLDENFAIKPAVEISDQCNSIFGGLLRLTITTRKQCEQFLTSCNGLEFLENRLCRLSTGNIIYDMMENNVPRSDNNILKSIWKYQEDWYLLKEPLIKVPLQKMQPSSGSISTVSSTASISSTPSIPSTPSSSKAKKPIKPSASVLSMSKYKMSAKKASDSKKQSNMSINSSRANSVASISASNLRNNADSSVIQAAPLISMPYNRNSHQISTSFPVSTKSQSSSSDLLQNLKGLSIVNSTQYWNLTSTQLGDSCDLNKIFNPAEIKIQNYANRKITKIQQKSSAKFNKDFNWSHDGIKDGGSHVNLSVNYNNEQSISFQINQTIEIKDITIAFNNILQANSSNRPIPTSVTMNFGLTEDMRNSVRLERIHDPHFGTSAVYSINMHTVPNSCKTLRRAMQNFKRLKVRFISFSFQKGYYFGIRNNINQKNLTNNNSEILKFLEINGYPVTNIGNYISYIGMQRRSSTLKFVSELVRDNNKLQCGALLRDVISAIDQGLMRQYLKADTKSAMEFLQIIYQQIKDSQSLESIMGLLRRFIEQKILTTTITVSQMKEIKKLLLKLIFNYKRRAIDDQNIIEKVNSNLNLQAVIRRLNGWIQATIFRIDQGQTLAAKYLADIVNTVLLVAAKEHITQQGKLIGKPLVMDQYPNKEHVLRLASACITNPQTHQFTNLLSLFLNPSLGIVFSSFNIEELYTNHQGDQQVQNLIYSVISSSNNDIAQNQFKKLQDQLLIQVINIIQNPQKEAEHILVTKIIQWTQRYSIRKSLVNQNFGIELYLNLKSNFTQIKSKRTLVQKLVNCIKKLVYGFPEVQDKLASIILQDDQVFDEKNQDFNSSVLFPLLFGQQTLNIALNPYINIGDKRVWLSLPDCPNNSTEIGPLAIKLLSTYSQQLVAVSGFPFKSTVFSPQQKKMFCNFYINTLTPGQQMLMQFMKFTTQGNLSPNNFSIGLNMLSFGTGLNKSTKINYTVGLFSMSSVESLMKIKGDSSQHTYFFIYSNGPNKKQYHHFRLRPKYLLPGKKAHTHLFQLDNKVFYFPSKQKYIFKLDENKSSGSSSPYGMVFSNKKPLFEDQYFISLDSSQKFAQLNWPFSVKQAADDMPPIYMKVVSGQIQSFLNNLNVNQMIKGYEFSHPFFQSAKMDKFQFSYMSEEEIKRNPWHDKNIDFVSRLNPKWKIPQGASLIYIIEQLFNIKMVPDIKIKVHKNGNLVNLNNKLSELIIEHNDFANAMEQDDLQEEKKVLDIEFKELIEGQRRKIKSQSQTMEFDIDLTNLLEVLCANKVSSILSTSAASPKEPKKLTAPKKKTVLISKKIKKASSDVGISLKKQQNKEANKQQEEDVAVVEDYQPQLGLFKSFSRQAGFNKIVKLLRSKISTSNSTQECINQLTAWLQQIEDFSKFPNYEQKLLKNKQCRDFFLEDVIRCENIVQKFLERKEEIRNVPFQTLSTLFSLDPDPQLRKTALDKNIIKNVLRNIQALTNEVSRKYDSAFDKNQEEKRILEKEEQAKRQREKKRKQEEQIKNTDKKKRKGVGYVTNQGKVWNIQQYMKDREARNQRVGSFIDFIASLFDSDNWQPTEEHTKPLLESCLLPLIESSFTAGSLVNLVKDFPLVMSVFNLVTVFVRHQSTAKLLTKIDQKYRPPQRQSIFELMKKLKELSDIFLKCLGSQQQSMKSSSDSLSDHKGQDVAKAIQSSYQTVERSLMEYKLIQGDEQVISDALSLPLPQAYIALLKDLRFDYMKLNKTNGKYVHFYEQQAMQQQTSPPTKMVRLAQQLADLSTALPIDHTNAIFVRVDRERIDLMKAIIFGANGTPYAHGAFEYDLYLPQKYPQVCPKCNLTTTGAGQVRFNPNLYSSGKVCLSLLGTWRGNANENWDPKVSTILQVLLSIQAVVMSEEVYFNEPGYENTAGTPEGEKKNEGYSNIVKWANIKYAMIEQIKNPPKGFQTVIRRHFYLKREQILEEVKSWIPLAEKNQANYTGLVSSHNWKWCELFKKEKLTFRDKLVQVIEELQTQIKRIAPPSIRDMSSSSPTKADKKGQQKVKIDLKKQAQSLQNIDVDDEDQATAKAAAKEMDISDEKVKDRWSRYIGAMGVDAVAKQAAARVLVSGAGALGIEISKNLVLAGCKSFTLHDQKLAKWNDLSGQFFLSHKDINKNRATASINKLQQLNFYVKVNSMIEDIDEACVKIHDVIIITDPDSIEQIIEINGWCRKHGAKFILAEAYGLFARVFDDFGDKFQVLDKNGEELQEVMIKEIKQIELQEKVKKQEVKIQQVPGEMSKEDDDDQWVKIKRPKCQVQLLEGVRHNFQDGDLVILSQIQGMNLKTPTKTEKSINGQKFKVKVISPSKFILQDLNMNLYSAYENNGICKQLKQPITINYKTFEKAALDKQPTYDMNLMISDFQKMSHWDIMHDGMMNLTKWKSEQNGGLPPMNANQAREFIKSSKQIIKESGKQINQDTCDKVLTAIALTARGVFNPISSFIGGMVAQECVKAITGKFSPLNQLFYFNAIELLPQLPKKKEQEKKSEEEKQQPVKEADQKKEEKKIEDDKKVEESKQSNKEKENKEMEENDLPSKTQQDQKSFDYLDYWTESSRLPFNHKNQQRRDCGLTSSIGISLTETLAKMKLFMVGAGAIGCQLLKNYAMLGLGASDDGLIVLTDPDVIEVSNLNRQFLFREKHLRKPKASTAAAAAIAMNPQLKGRIFARLDKVFPGTEHIFTDKFFKELTIVTNALDNIQARRYVDNRCVTARTPLLESGTLGPKGHVQVILPGKTQSYGSQQDPENQNDIPICTLKMFPQQTVHCVQWARDQFGKLFTQNPQSLNRVLEPDFLEGGGPKDSADLTALHKAVKMLKKMPRTWNDCVFAARLKFQKYFVNDIRQLLYTYPLDKMTKEGKPFWSSPKRPPFEMIFDKGEQLHQTFLVAFATLTAKIYGIEPPKNLRKDWELKAKLAMKCTEIQVPDFKPDKRKAEAIAKEVENEQEKKKGEKIEEEQQTQSSQADMDVGKLIEQLKELKQKLPSNIKVKDQQTKQKGSKVTFLAFPEQFEKDNDENCHIDFIYSLANCRSRNYKLQQMSWINVKLKAGRIVPALATTTAAVSGLQTLELVKIARNCTMEEHRNVFLNLALPSMTASEPGPAEVVLLNKDLKVTLWDRWDVKLGPDVSLGQMLKYLEQTYQLQALDVMKGNTPIFFHAIMNAAGKQNEKKAIMEKKMRELLQIDIQAEKEEEKEGYGVYRDVTVTFRKLKDAVEKEGKQDLEKEEKEELKVLKGVPPVRIYFDEIEAQSKV